MDGLSTKISGTPKRNPQTVDFGFLWFPLHPPKKERRTADRQAFATLCLPAGAMANVDLAARRRLWKGSGGREAKHWALLALAFGVLGSQKRGPLL